MKDTITLLILFDQSQIWASQTLQKILPPIMTHWVMRQKRKKMNCPFTTSTTKTTTTSWRKRSTSCDWGTCTGCFPRTKFVSCPILPSGARTEYLFSKSSRLTSKIEKCIRSSKIRIWPETQKNLRQSLWLILFKHESKNTSIKTYSNQSPSIRKNQNSKFSWKSKEKDWKKNKNRKNRIDI